MEKCKACDGTGMVTNHEKPEDRLAWSNDWVADGEFKPLRCKDCKGVGKKN